EAVIQSGHSRILIYETDIDHIIGYCHASTWFQKESEYPPILSIPITPEAMLAKDLLLRLLKEHKSVALVVDEYGGTAGLITVEDIIEKIMGKIEDEHDEPILLEEALGADTYHFSARLEVKYLNHQYNLQLPEGEYDTLGGLLMAHSKNIPDHNQIVQVGQYQIKIISKIDNRIDKIHLSLDKEQS
ncbi:MAG: CBS domain-containing protein, partial [Cytophagales bacterium]|nr:CBS domain-containing protein [Cytophagales bacterium]